MVLRVAHIADQHFNAHSRWEETLRLLNAAADEMERRDVNLITLGGDLFERSTPRPAEIAAAARWVIRLGNIAEVVGVVGNHDPIELLPTLGLFETDNPVTFYDQPWVHRAHTSEGDVAVMALPWPQRGSLHAALGDVGTEQVENEARLGLQSILRGLGVAADDTELARRVLLGHCMVRGSRVSTGQPLIGMHFEVGLEDLALARARAYLLGHVHAHNLWDIDRAPVIMPGAPRRTAFGELEPKGFALVELDEGGGATWEFVELPATRMIQLDEVWFDEHTGITRSIGEIPTIDSLLTLADVRDSEVRLRWRVPAEHREAARIDALQYADELRAAGAVSVKLEEQVLSTSRSRTPEVARATTLPEQLDAFWKSRSDQPEGERRGRLLGKLADACVEYRS